MNRNTLWAMLISVVIATILATMLKASGITDWIDQQTPTLIGRSSSETRGMSPDDTNDNTGWWPPAFLNALNTEDLEGAK